MAELKIRNIIVIISLTVFLLISYFNWKYEVIAFNPFWDGGKFELKIMTWNVHCSNGADAIRQRQIAELILQEDADFLLLNEYNQDSCKVADSLLRVRYHYTEESRSHTRCGDIFYSKYAFFNSGRIKAPEKGIPFQTIKATIAIGCDSVQIFGVHMASNHYDDGTIDNELVNNITSYDRYKDAQKDRNFQAHLTKMVVLKSAPPVIVMGDMNDFSCSAPLDTLSTCGLKNGWWEGGNGYGCTFHDGWMRLRIDHILYSEKLKLHSIKVIDTKLSDHNPVVAGLSINN